MYLPTKKLHTRITRERHQQKQNNYGMNCTINMAQNNNCRHLRLEVIDP